MNLVAQESIAKILEAAIETISQGEIIEIITEINILKKDISIA